MTPYSYMVREQMIGKVFMRFALRTMINRIEQLFQPTKYGVLLLKSYSLALQKTKECVSTESIRRRRMYLMKIYLTNGGTSRYALN